MSAKIAAHHPGAFASDESRIAVSPADAARLLGVGRTLLYSFIRDGSLKTSKLGSRRIITMEAIRAWLAANEAKP